jgi:hypothetical protein
MIQGWRESRDAVNKKIEQLIFDDFIIKHICIFLILKHSGVELLINVNLIAFHY